MKALFAELRRRNVFRVALGYVVVAWLVLQVASVLAPILAVPSWIGRAVLLILVAGFPVSLVLAWAFELTPKGIQREDEPSGAMPARPVVAAGRKLDFVIICALCAALGYFVWQRFDATSTSRSGPIAEDSAADAAQTLAVLPFVNLSSDPEQDYFSDGLSEELLNQLAQISGLRVTGRTSAFVFKGHNEDLRTIGEKLGVRHILEGSVRKSGNRLRITAQLVSASDGYHLWSETFDRDLNDICAIQESVARAVTSALGVTLGIGDATRATGGTTNLEAYDKYLSARALFNQSGSIARAAEIYREALALDP